VTVETELDLLPKLICRSAEPLPEIGDPTFGARFVRVL
jgi:hypothetical protein